MIVGERKHVSDFDIDLLGIEVRPASGKGGSLIRADRRDVAGTVRPTTKGYPLTLHFSAEVSNHQYKQPAEQSNCLHEVCPVTPCGATTAFTAAV